MIPTIIYILLLLFSSDCVDDDGDDDAAGVGEEVNNDYTANAMEPVSESIVQIEEMLIPTALLSCS
jgi:hypothetical protein